MHRSLFLATLALPLFAAPAMAHEVVHGAHDSHAHAKGCGHQALEHAGHIDYLHDGHLHHVHATHVDEHVLEVTTANPDAEELVAHVTDEAHPHGHPGEEHMTVQHGDHIDFVHNGHLHHKDGDHFDDHGAVKLVASV